MAAPAADPPAGRPRLLVPLLQQQVARRLLSWHQRSHPQPQWQLQGPPQLSWQQWQQVCRS
jgi:hypothetical protein